jgi:hypothetical protein
MKRNAKDSNTQESYDDRIRNTQAWQTQTIYAYQPRLKPQVEAKFGARNDDLPTAFFLVHI